MTPARVAGVVGALIALMIAVWLLTPRERYLATNGAGSVGPVLRIAAPAEACVPVVVPAGTGRLRVKAAEDGVGSVAGRLLDLRGREVAAGAMTARSAGGLTAFELAVPEDVATALRNGRGSPDHVAGAFGARLCLRPAGGALTLAGRPGPQPMAPPVTVGGAPAGARVQAWALPPAGRRQSLLAALPAAARRAALFRPGWVGAWTLWLVLAGSAALAVAAVGLVVGAGRTRRPVLAVALVAFGACVCWSLVTPSFNAPDETEHVAYAQAVAELGRAPDTAPSARKPFSSELLAAVEGAQVAGQLGQHEGRPPWQRATEDAWRARVSRERPPADDGGGFSTGAPYQPLYYAALAPAYRAAGGSPFTRLWAMRLVSALLIALGAAATALLVGELLPGRPWAVLGGGLLFALQPMLTFVGGTVNNDTAVDAGTAIVLWLLVRAVRRGLAVRVAAALGTALVLVPVAKGSGLAVWPAAVLALAVVARRDRPWRALGVLAAAAAVTALAWAGAAAALQHAPDPTVPARLSADPTAFPTSPGGTLPSPVRAVEHPAAFARWLWELWLPPLPGMDDVRPTSTSTPGFVAHVRRAWASFGMVAVEFPAWVYQGILLAVLACAVAAARVLLTGGRLRRHLTVVGVLVLAALTTYLGVEAVFFAEQPGGVAVPEFGRYDLPAAPVAAALAMGACLLAGRRAPAAAAGLVTAMAGLQVASVLVAVEGFFA